MSSTPTPTRRQATAARRPRRPPSPALPSRTTPVAARWPALLALLARLLLMLLLLLRPPATAALLLSTLALVPALPLALVRALPLPLPLTLPLVPALPHSVGALLHRRLLLPCLLVPHAPLLRLLSLLPLHHPALLLLLLRLLGLLLLHVRRLPHAAVPRTAARRTVPALRHACSMLLRLAHARHGVVPRPRHPHLRLDLTLPLLPHHARMALALALLAHSSRLPCKPRPTCNVVSLRRHNVAVRGRLPNERC